MEPQEPHHPDKTCHGDKGPQLQPRRHLFHAIESVIFWALHAISTKGNVETRADFGNSSTLAAQKNAPV